MFKDLFISIMTLAAGLMLNSCQKGDGAGGPERLTVGPAVVEAGADMKDYTINVTSNARWTASLKSKDGKAVDWMNLGTTSGIGDAQVNVRLKENGRRDSREAEIHFRSEGGIKTVVTVRQHANENLPEEVFLRVGSYNIRMSNLDTGDNLWAVRKERLKQSIIECNFDVFGLQEVSTEAQAWLDSELASRYTCNYFSPYSQSGKGIKAQGIAYRKGEFEISDWYYFWAWEKPDVMGVNDKGSSGNYNRGGCCCILTHKATGLRIFVMNNHGFLDDDANARYAGVYVDIARKRNPESLPTFFVGDMNAGPTPEAGSVYMTYTSYWKDSYASVDPSKRLGPRGTYNGFSEPSGKSRIDYVFFGGKDVTPLTYCCSNKLYGGLYASDHFPVWVDFRILQ